MSLSDLDDFLAEAVAAYHPPQPSRRVKVERTAAEEYAAGLAKKAVLRRLLEASELDAARFQYWFTVRDTRFTLSEWRERIDQMILNEKGRSAS